MKYRFAPLAVCAFVVASTSLAGSTVSARTTSLAPHAVGARALSSATTLCTGPDTTGPNSFNGVPNVGNTAGGLASSGATSGYAGIVAGCTNVADAQYAFIGAGYDNSVAGFASSIIGGSNNIISAGSYSTIGGGLSNTIYSVSGYGVIAGGANNTVIASTGVIGGGSFNRAGSAEATVAGGGHNNAYGSGAFIGGGGGNSANSGSTVGGGGGNLATGPSATIGGGGNNAAAGINAAIGGGTNNNVTATAIWGTIAGGSYNYATGSTSAIGGGYRNAVSGLYATVPGGSQNTASGVAAVIAGGSNNTASGSQAAVPGGQRNSAAGENSFAAGTLSNASTAGTFVWSDDASGSKAMTPTMANQFFARASGGFYLYSSAKLSSGVSLAPGSGAWSTLSDRNVKTAIEQVEPTRILAQLAAMPVSEWSYTAQGTGVRHLGPMAQDFRAAFGLGEDDRHISTVDEEGVALAAIKALETENEARRAEIATKDREISDLDTKYARLAARLDALEAKAAR